MLAAGAELEPLYGEVLLCKKALAFVKSTGVFGDEVSDTRFWRRIGRTVFGDMAENWTIIYN